ncbi:MAG: immunity 27 family protein [Anaerolineales bacterium]|jgi:hypothetical protein|nr:immunity 27 family protein [Anaerolineales bacterium]
MNCNCQNISELEGNAALEYIESHLSKIRVDGKTWQVFYECPLTGIQWVKDYPHSEYHGGGSPRLRRLPLSLET